MMAEPTAPGRGLLAYQPATDVDDGTCITPPAARPSVISRVFTPISGMVSETGLAGGVGSGDCGAAAIGPGGAGSAAAPAVAGRMTGAECLVSSKPPVPATITTRPAATMIAAGLRLIRVAIPGNFM